MAEQIDKLDELEQLSLLLDELNAGRDPHCDDVEMTELLLVANILRKEGRTIQPPQHILDQTVDRALAGIEAGQTKPKRLWWYSGAFSTAAAVLLVIGLNLLPSWQQQTDVIITPPTIRQEQTAPPTQATPPTQTAPAQNEPIPSSKSSSDYIELRTAEPVQLPVVQSPALEPLKEKAVASLPSKPETAKPSPFATISEEIGPKLYTKSINLLDDTSAAPSKTNTPELSPLVLPGKSPDQVVFYKEQGILRQVFFKGTPQELIIVQRQKPADNRIKQEKANLPAVDKAVSSKKDRPNVVQIIIAGQEVTVEGYQSPQELRKLAETLTPK